MQQVNYRSDNDSIIADIVRQEVKLCSRKHHRLSRMDIFIGWDIL